MDDKELQCDIIDELDFDPRVDSTDIGVTVEGGVVTLTGHAATYAQKLDAERAVWRVTGVTAIVQKMDVHTAADGPTDEQLAARAVGLLRWDSTVPEDVHVTVADGWITLEGEVHADYQRRNAERTLRHLTGLKGIHNAMLIRGVAEPVQVRERIVQALERNAGVDASRVHVQVEDGATVRLEGNVRNWAERSAARDAAWNAPGVRAVIDRLAIA